MENDRHAEKAQVQWNVPVNLKRSNVLMSALHVKSSLSGPKPRMRDELIILWEMSLEERSKVTILPFAISRTNTFNCAFLLHLVKHTKHFDHPSLTDCVPRSERMEAQYHVTAFLG